MTHQEVKNNAHGNVLSPFKALFMKLSSNVQYHAFITNEVSSITILPTPGQVLVSYVLGYMYEAECCDMRKGQKAGAATQEPPTDWVNLESKCIFH